MGGRALRLPIEVPSTLEDDVARRVLGGGRAGRRVVLLGRWPAKQRALTRVRGLDDGRLGPLRRGEGRAMRRARSAGRTFPFFEVPMPCATAHLASAAARGGATASRSWRPPSSGSRGSGGRGRWGEPGQPSDILTTLAVAELMGVFDPGFDPGRRPGRPGRSSLRRAGAGGPRGTGVAVGRRRAARVRGLEPPTVPGALPVAARATLDDRRAHRGARATRPISRMRACSERARPGRRARGDLVLDMAGFGAWNTKHGQAAGDELLALLTSLLRSIPESRDDMRWRRRVPGDRVRRSPRGSRSGCGRRLAAGSRASETARARSCRSCRCGPSSAAALPANCGTSVSGSARPSAS